MLKFTLEPSNKIFERFWTQKVCGAINDNPPQTSVSGRIPALYSYVTPRTDPLQNTDTYGI